MPFGTLQLVNFLRGVVLTSLPDQIADGTFRRGTNIRVDRSLGNITNRPGWTQQTDSALSAAIVWISRLFGTTTDFGYVQHGSTLTRLNTNWEAAITIATPGIQIVSDANTIDGEGGIWKFIVNGSIAVKNAGASLTQNIGIAAPADPPQAAVLAADLTTTIDTMNATTGWAGSGLASGPATEGTVKIQGTNSLTFTINASTLGSITKDFSTTNLDTLSGGDNTVKNDDYIHLWVRFDTPANLEFMQIDFDLDAAGSFASNYYSVRVSPLTRLNQGANQWNKLQVRKSEFQKFGESANDWSAIRWARISFMTNANGAITVYVDDFKLRGGVGIEGDIEYTVTYRNSVTGCRGNPPKDADGAVEYTTKLTTDRQRVTLTLTDVAQGGADHPGDTQIDKIMIWRKGGQFSTAVLVDTIDDTTTTYTDNTSDSTLVLTVEELESDNDTPPTGSSRVLFGPDATGHLFMIVDQYRLYFSKPYEDEESRGENWPADQFALIGDGSHKAVAGITTDTDTFVWNESQTYQVIGNAAETFLPIPIPNSHECIGQFAVAAGAGSVFFVANDGIYAQSGGQQRKITWGIDPFFNGVTVDGQLPMNRDRDARADVRLVYFPDPQSDCLIMLYPDSSSTTCNKSLVMKRNLQNGELTEVFFGSSNLTDVRALYVDLEKNEAFAGATNGHVYQIEDPDTENDAGTDIPIQFRTRSLDFGAPQTKKKIAAVMLEGNTGGEALDVTAYYNRNTLSEVLTDINTSSLNTVSHHTTADPTARRDDLAVDVSGSVGSRLTISRIACEVEVLPEPLTFYDSGVITFAQIQHLQRFEFDLYAPDNDVTVRVYILGVLKDTRVVNLHGQQRVLRHYLPRGLKGYDVRVTLTCATAIEIFSALLFTKALGATTGWQGRQVQFAA